MSSKNVKGGGFYRRTYQQRRFDCL